MGYLVSGCFVSNVMSLIEKQLAETKGVPTNMQKKTNHALQGSCQLTLKSKAGS